MSFFNDIFSAFNHFAEASALEWALTFGIILVVSLIVILVRRITKERRETIDFSLCFYEWVLTMFFVVLAIPGLMTVLIQAGKHTSATIVAISGLLFLLLSFSKFLIAIERYHEQRRELRKRNSSEQPSSSPREAVPTWATVGVIVGISALVLLRRTKVS